MRIDFFRHSSHASEPLLASGEETTDLDKVVFLLAAHLVNKAAGGERF